MRKLVYNVLILLLLSAFLLPCVPVSASDEGMTVDVQTQFDKEKRVLTFVFSFGNVDGLYACGIWFETDENFVFSDGRYLVGKPELFDADAVDGYAAAYSECVPAEGGVASLTFSVSKGTEIGEYSICFFCSVEDGGRIVNKRNVTVTFEVPDYARGDVDENGKVNSADAIYLLRHTMRASKYPINQNGDMNGDAKINSSDAIYLLRYTMRPSKYPLCG